MFIKQIHPFGDEDQNSAIGKHLRDHALCATYTINRIKIYVTTLPCIQRKCRGKLDCLIDELLFIKEKEPKLNTQSGSIKAKLSDN